MLDNIASAPLAIPKYTGKFALTNQQVARLEFHHKNLVTYIIGWLDGDYRVTNQNREANWPMLGQHLIELLVLSDYAAFRDICQKVNASITALSLPVNHHSYPFIIASLAEAGDTENDLFQEGLKNFTSLQTNEGYFMWNTGFLAAAGAIFSTLWTLRLIHLSGTHEKYAKEVDRAISVLESNTDHILKEKDDIAGFFLWVLLGFERTEDKKRINALVEHLLRKDAKWITDISRLTADVPLERGGEYSGPDLRASSFAAYDLLFASQLNGKAMHTVERWLKIVFSLDTEPEGVPLPLESIRPHPLALDAFDVWGQGWIRALIVATLYLRIRHPSYSAAPFYVSHSILGANQLKTVLPDLVRYQQLTTPYVPIIEHMLSERALLDGFWQHSKYDDSVFIMRRMPRGAEEADSTGDIVKAINEELAKVGLVGRYVGDRANYSRDLFANNQIYMRGCKYGIAVCEQIRRKVEIGKPSKPPDNISLNVLIEMGFMFGKASDILILLDKTTAHEDQLPSLLSGILWKAFDSDEDNLESLRSVVMEWARNVVQK